MKLSSLSIDREYSYNAEFGKLRGTVKLSNDANANEHADSMTVKLSPECIAKIINVIAADVQKRAIDNAAGVKNGLRAAMAIDNGTMQAIEN